MFDKKKIKHFLNEGEKQIKHYGHCIYHAATPINIYFELFVFCLDDYNYELI